MKTKDAGKTCKSIEEWAQTYTPKAWKAERYAKLSKEPKELAKVQVEELFKSIKIMTSNQTFILISPNFDAIETHVGEDRYRTCLQDAVDGFRSSHWKQGWGADEECKNFCNGWGVYSQEPNGDLIKVATVTRDLIMIDEVDPDPKRTEDFLKAVLSR